MGAGRPDSAKLAAGQTSAVKLLPETQYARTDDGAHVAYQVVGDPPPVVVILFEDFFQLELMWEMPRYASVLRS
jgi:hypothetical protein